MNILHTIYDDAENPWCGGGGAVRAFEINRRLAKRHHITMLTGNFPGAIREEMREGIRFLRIGTPKTYALSRLSFSVQASRYIARAAFDLWIYDFSAFSPVWAPASHRLRAIPVVHHLMLSHAAAKYPGLGWLASAFEVAHLRSYRQFIAVSSGTARQMHVHVRPGTRVHAIHNGVDALCFDAPWGEADYILYFGRLDTHTKGIDILLRAFAKLDAPHVRLIIAGRGAPGRQRELQALAEGLGIHARTSFFGPASPEQKNDLIGKSLFVCMPSRYEGWGIVAIEASAAAKAVIGTDIPGLADAIRPDETGLLVPPENPEALSEAMQRLLADAALRKRLGQNGRTWARTFAWERIAAEQERVYLEMANRP